MRTVVKIEHVEELVNKQTGETYWRTHAILEDGTEAVGFGKDFDLGDPVEVFFHHNTVKMKKGGDK